MIPVSLMLEGQRCCLKVQSNMGIHEVSVTGLNTASLPGLQHCGNTAAPEFQLQSRSGLRSYASVSVRSLSPKARNPTATSCYGDTVLKHVTADRLSYNPANQHCAIIEGLTVQFSTVLSVTQIRHRPRRYS